MNVPPHAPASNAQENLSATHPGVAQHEDAAVTPIVLQWHLRCDDGKRISVKLESTLATFLPLLLDVPEGEQLTKPSTIKRMRPLLCKPSGISVIILELH